MYGYSESISQSKDPQLRSKWIGVFATFITKSGFENNEGVNSLFFYRKLFEIFPWQIILALCIWLQRKVNKEYSIVTELAYVLGLSVIFSLAEIISVALPKDALNTSNRFIGGFECFRGRVSLQ